MPLFEIGLFSLVPTITETDWAQEQGRETENLMGGGSGGFVLGRAGRPLSTITMTVQVRRCLPVLLQPIERGNW